MRIIGGSARGRQLKSPKGMLTRPTLDSTRESLFNILANYGLQDAAVLDILPERELSDWKLSAVVLPIVCLSIIIHST